MSLLAILVLPVLWVTGPHLVFGADDIGYRTDRFSTICKNRHFGRSPVSVIEEVG